MFTASIHARHVTVADCRAHSWVLTITCYGCGRKGQRLPAAMLDALPPAARLVDVAARTVCSACGAHDGEISTVNWRHPDHLQG